MVKNYVTAEVSASARPSDVVGAIMDSAMENRRREKMTWLDRAKQITWTQTSILALFCLGVAVLALTVFKPGPELSHDLEYHHLEQAHREHGLDFNDPDKDFVDDFGGGEAADFDEAVEMDLYYGDYDLDDEDGGIPTRYQDSRHRQHRQRPKEHHTTKELNVGHHHGAGRN